MGMERDSRSTIQIQKSEALLKLPTMINNGPTTCLPPGNTEVELSVVIPTYCEEECIHRCVAETVSTLESHKIDYELVFVDDGSTDNTVPLLRKEAQTHPRIKLVELARNHGKPAALTAGIYYANGKVIALMDPDLQDSPQDIQRLIAELNRGYDIVWGIRESREDGITTALTSRVFWWLLDRMTGLSVPRDLSAMRVFNSAFRSKFLEYREHSRFIEGIMLHAGMRQSSLSLAHHRRQEGTSKFTFRRKLTLALTAILDYSSIPLTLAIRCGVLLTAFGFTTALGLIVTRLFLLDFQLGWPSLIVTIITGFGLQILFTGLVGVYIGRTFNETKKRPLFSVNTLHGFSASRPMTTDCQNHPNVQPAHSRANDLEED